MCFEGDTLVCGTEDARVLGFRLGPASVGFEGVINRDHAGPVKALAMDSDNIYSGGADGTMRVSTLEVLQID